MNNYHGAIPEPTIEDIRRAAVRCMHTYDGATADEWQDQARTLSEGVGGDEKVNKDAISSQMIADALHELDEEYGSRMKVAGEKTETPMSLATPRMTLSGMKD